MRKKPRRSALAKVTGAVALTFLALVSLTVASLYASTATKLDGPAVILVTTETGPHCSGVHLGGGIILTAAHCIEAAERAKAIFTVGLLPVETLWVNETYDVALLHTDGWGLKSASLNCALPKPGDSISTTGAPLNFPLVTTHGTVLSVLLSDEVWKEYILVDLTVAPGSSGGPVFDKYGSVVGIAVGLAMPFRFAMVVPSPTICKLLGKV